MPRYMLFARDDVEWGKDVSAKEMQRIVERYIAWTQGLAEKNRLVLSHKLVDGDGRVVRGGGGKPMVADGPYVETKEVIGGFWIVEAADYDEAVALCADSPHLEFGALEIREIEY